MNAAVVGALVGDTVGDTVGESDGEDVGEDVGDAEGDADPHVGIVSVVHATLFGPTRLHERVVGALKTKPGWHAYVAITGAEGS